MRPTALFQLWGILLNPAEDRGMVNVQPPFQHEFLEIAIAERIPQIPAHAQQNDLGLEMTPFEQLRMVHKKASLLKINPSLPYRRRFCNTALNHSSSLISFHTPLNESYYIHGTPKAFLRSHLAPEAFAHSPLLVLGRGS